jgi:hypothetical protein
LRDNTLGGTSGQKYKDIIQGIKDGKLIATDLSTYTTAGLVIPNSSFKVCDFSKAVTLGYDVYTFANKYASLSTNDFKNAINKLPKLD